MAKKLKTEAEKLAHLLFVKGVTKKEAESIMGKSAAHFRVIYHEMTDMIVEKALGSKKNVPITEQLTRRSYKWGAGVRALMMDVNKKEAIRIAKNTLRVAEKYDLVTALALSRLLFNYYGYYNLLGPSELRRIGNKVIFIQKELNLEVEIEMILTKINYCILKSKDHGQLKKELNKFSEGLSWRYNYLYYLSRLKVFQIENNDIGVEQTCTEAISCLNQYEFPLPYHVRYSFLIAPIPTYIKSQKNKEADAAIERLFREIENSTGMKKKNFNWHVGMYLRIINSFYSGNYKEAKLSWEHATKNNKISNFVVNERLKVVEGVLHVLSLSGDIKMDSSFKLGKFINGVPRGSSDKKGLNVSIKTVTLLYMFLRSKKSTNQRQKTYYRNKFFKEVDTLAGYIKKHLIKSDSSILKLFIAVEKANHRIYLFEKYEMKIVKKNPGNDFYDSAILPYETVKRIITANLK